MYNYGTNTNIVYLNYSTSSVDTGYYDNTVKKDSLFNIIKDSTIIVDTPHLSFDNKVMNTLK